MVTRPKTSNIHTKNQICGKIATKKQGQLKWLLPDGSTGDFVVNKEFIPQFNCSFLNRISLLLISSSYPNYPHETGWTPFQTLYFQKNFYIYPGIEPDTSRMAVRRANHYTKQVVLAQ